MKVRTIDPSTGAILAEYPQASDAEVAARVASAARAQRDWARWLPAERAERLRALAAILEQDAKPLARLMALEMGKPLGQGRAEILKCASACEHYASRADEMLAPEAVATDASRSFVDYRPLGLILAVMPWNFPFWQVIRFAAPALLAGNGAILKHAAGVTGCSLALEELFRSAGFPEGLFASLVLSHEQVAELVEHPAIRALTLTGSTEAGRRLAPLAARAIKKCVLELGGSDPAIVLEDADLDLAAASCASARLLNSGQSCIAAKRFIVVAPVLEEFTRRFVERMAAARVGSPLEDGIDVGPLARHDLREALHDQVRRSVERGARLLLGGVLPEGPGAFYAPTVLADVGPGSPVFDEETFGPVAAIIAAADEADAVALANRTPYGLGASVYTRDAERGERLAREELEAGSCFVNGLVKSDPRLPFGGVKESGYGREFSVHGLREFVNVKSIWIR